MGVGAVRTCDPSMHNPPMCVCGGRGGVGRVRAGNSVSVRVFVFRVRVCFILLCMTMYE